MRTLLAYACLLAIVPTLSAIVPFSALLLPMPRTAIGWMLRGIGSAVVQGAVAAFSVVFIFRWLGVTPTATTVIVLLFWFGLNDIGRATRSEGRLRAKRLLELLGESAGILGGFAILWL